MRNSIPGQALFFLLMAALTVVAISCEKTAEDTNKPVIIQGFNFTVDSDTATSAGTLQIEPGKILTIEVVYTDPDADPEDDPAWFSHTWAVERIGTGLSTFNPNDYFIVFDENPCIWTAPDVTGFYRFFVEVRDRYGTPSQETVVVEVNDNKQPIINEINISDPSPYVNDEITITVVATDPDGDLPLEYIWQADGGYFTYEGDGEARWQSPVAGDFTITILINDQKGGSVSRTIPIVVQANHDPVIEGWDLDPGNSVIVNSLVTITLTVTDEDDDDLEYNWSLDFGTFNSVNQNVAVWRAPDTAQACMVTCIVEDNKGGTDSVDIAINVTEEPEE